MPGSPRVAIICPPDPQDPEAPSGRFGAIGDAFVAAGATVAAIPYRDTAAEEVRRALVGMDAALVWINPLQEGHDRAVLDAVLRDAKAGGVLVSADPDVILRMGTKEVLWATRELPWSTGDVHLYRSAAELRDGLGARLPAGPRVLKQYRGNDGQGVWRVDAGDASGTPTIRVLHAAGGSRSEEMGLDAFVARCAGYFVGNGRVIDQPFVSPVPYGMVRCYLTREAVVGFGQQRVTALVPPEHGGPVPAPAPRRYFPADQPEFGDLRERMESEWVWALERVVGVAADNLPLIWDADFLVTGPAGGGGERYRLCEINVSSVYPFPESALPRIVDATLSACAT